MAIRNRPREQFTQIRNQALLDDDLSLKAKGLLAIMLSRPDNWTYHMDWLENQSKEGRTATRNAMKELCEAGYVTRERVQDEKGRITWLYTVGDQRQDVTSSIDGFSIDGQAFDGEPAATNTDSNNTEESNTDLEKPIESTSSSCSALADTDMVRPRPRPQTNAQNVLISEFPTTWRVLSRISQAKRWVPEQLSQIAKTVLIDCHSHGDRRMSEALERVLENLSEVRHFVPFYQAVLQAKPKADAFTTGAHVLLDGETKCEVLESWVRNDIEQYYLRDLSDPAIIHHARRDRLSSLGN